jgi:hypothetical protein
MGLKEEVSLLIELPNIRNLVLQIDVEMSAFVVYLFSLLHSYYSITAKLETPRPPSSP